MATQVSGSQGQMGGQTGGMQGGSQSASSPVDDVTYDVLTILQQKCEGLQAYQKYMKDVSSNEEVRRVLENVRQSDMQCVEQLRTCLIQLMGSNGGNGGSKIQSSGSSTSNRLRTAATPITDIAAGQKQQMGSGAAAPRGSRVLCPAAGSFRTGVERRVNGLASFDRREVDKKDL